MTSRQRQTFSARVVPTFSQSLKTQRGEELEYTIWQYVKGYVARPDLTASKLKKQARAETSPSRVSEQIADLEQKRARNVEGRKTVLRQLGAGLLPEADVRDAVGGINADIAKIDQQLFSLRNLKAEHEAMRIDFDWAGRLLGELKEDLHADNLTFEEKRRFILSLVAGIRIPVNGGLPEVTFRLGPIFNARKRGVVGV